MIIILGPILKSCYTRVIFCAVIVLTGCTMAPSFASIRYITIPTRYINVGRAVTRTCMYKHKKIRKCQWTYGPTLILPWKIHFHSMFTVFFPLKKS